MKKIIAVLLATVLLLTMMGCDGATKELTPMEVYTKINEASDAVSSMESNMDMKMSIVADSMSMDISMTGTIRQVIRSETDIDMEMLMKMSIPDMGMEMEQKGYYTDGWMYQDVMGSKIKTRVPVDEVMSQMGADINASVAEEAIKNIEMTRSDSGDYNLTVELDAEKMTGMVDDLMASMGDMLNGEDADITFGAMKYVMVADKDFNMKTTDMQFAMDMEVAGEKAAVDYVISIETVSVNSIEKIDFPSDLDTYVEM